MRTIGVAGVLLTLVFAFSSCSVKLGNPPDDEKPATSAKPADGPSATAGPKVVTLVAGDQRDESSKDITTATTSFTTETGPIYVNAAVKDLTQGAKITARLMAVDVTTADGAKVRDTEVVSTDVTAPGESATANFEFSPPDKGWPAGSYRMHLLVDGQEVDTLDLTIAKP